MSLHKASASWNTHIWNLRNVYIVWKKSSTKHKFNQFWVSGLPFCCRYFPYNNKARIMNRDKTKHPTKRRLKLPSMVHGPLEKKTTKRLSRFRSWKKKWWPTSRWLLPRFLRRWMVDAIHFRSSLALSCFSWFWCEKTWVIAVCCWKTGGGGVGGKFI